MPPLDFAAQRQTMVDSQVRVSDVTDLNIQTAMRTVPSEVFCPPTKAYFAYADAEIEYAPGRWLLRPRDVAKLLQAVRPRTGERALAIAAPYAAAILPALGLTVTQSETVTIAGSPSGIAATARATATSKPPVTARPNAGSWSAVIRPAS